MIDCGAKTVTIAGLIIGNAEPPVQSATVKTASVCRIQLAESTVIHPGQERFLSASIERVPDSPFDGTVEAIPDFVNPTSLAVATVRVPKGQKHIRICVTNVWERPVKVWRCQAVATLSEVTPVTLNQQLNHRTGRQILMTLSEIYTMVQISQVYNSTNWKHC